MCECETLKAGAFGRDCNVFGEFVSRIERKHRPRHIKECDTLRFILSG